MADATIDLRIEKLEQAVQGLRDIQKNLNGVDDSVNKVNKSLDDLNTELLEQKDVIEDIQKEEKQLSNLQKKGGRDYSKELKRVKSDLIVAKNEQRKITDQIKRTVTAQKQSTKEAERSTTSFKKLARTLGIAFGVREIIRFTKKLNELAIESEAFRNRAKVVFGDSFGFVDEFAGKSAISLGLTKDGFLGAAAAIGDLLVPLGLSRQKAAELSVDVTKLGVALKRFSGSSKTAAEISDAVARSFTGEVEKLKPLGVQVDLTSKEFKELVKNKKADLDITSQQAKALAIYDEIVRQSTDALQSLGDTSDSLQSQNEQLNAQIEQLQENIAEKLTPSLLLLTEAWNQFLSGDLFSDAARLRTSIDEITEGAETAQETFDKIVEARKVSVFTIKELEEEVTAARLAGDREGRDLAQGALDFERQLKNILIELEQEFANKVIEERKKVAEEGDAVAKEQIRNIAFLREEITKLTKLNSEGLNLTKAENIANIKKINALKEELRALTEVNKKKVENIDLTKQQIDTITLQSTSTLEKLADLYIKLEEQAKESQDIQTVNIEGFQEGILESARQTSAEIVKLTEEEKQARIEAAAIAFFGVTSLLKALAGEQQKYAGFVKAISVVEIIANGALALSNALATTSSLTADNALTGGIAGLVKYATISGIILSTVASAITSVQGASIPGFAEGVIGLDGPGTTTSDSILSMLSRGESVMTAKETDQYRPVLESMRDGNFDKEYFDKHTVIEMANNYEASKNQSFADNIASSLALMNSVDNEEHFYKLRRHGGNTVHYLRSIDEKLTYKNKKIR